eukprot:m.31783 g.31783  ORF g.31783 m.31783 type:complete len:382 (+) comp14034_c0_seq3:513-1658(+)
MDQNTPNGHFVSPLPEVQPGQPLDLLRKQCQSATKSTEKRRGDEGEAMLLLCKEATFGTGRKEQIPAAITRAKAAGLVTYEKGTDVYCIWQCGSTCVINGGMYRQQQICTLFQRDQRALQEVGLFGQDFVAVIHLIKIHATKKNETPRSISYRRIYGAAGDVDGLSEYAKRHELFPRDAYKIVDTQSILTTVDELVTPTLNGGNFETESGCVCDRRKKCEELRDFRRTHVCDGTKKLKHCPHSNSKTAWKYDGSCCTYARQKLTELVPGSRHDACTCTKVDHGAYDMYGKESKYAKFSDVIFDANPRKPYENSNAALFFYDKQLRSVDVPNVPSAAIPQKKRVSFTAARVHTATGKNSVPRRAKQRQCHAQRALDFNGDFN